MNQHAKKTLVLIVIISMILSISACSTSGTVSTTTVASTTVPTQNATTPLTDNTTQTASATESSTPTPVSYVKSAEPITIHIGKLDGFSFYGQNKDYNSAEDNIWITKLKESLNIDFVFDWIAPDSNSNNIKWNTAMAAGSLPDMGVIDRVTYESLLEAGKIADMTEQYNTYASPMLRSLVEPSYELSYMTRDGRLYGLPQTYAYPQSFDVLVLRKDWLDKVGKQVPKTIDELIDVATAFKDAQLGGINTYGLALDGAGNTSGGTMWGSWKGFFQGFGIPYSTWALDETGNVYYGNTDKRMEQALLRLQSMYKLGLLKQDYLVANTTESVTAGEAGMLYCICFGPVRAVDLYQKDPNVDMIAAEIPTLNGSLPTYYDSAVPSAFVFVNADFDHKDTAVAFINQIVDNLYDMTYDWGYIRGVCPIGNVMYEKPFSYCVYAQEITYASESGDTSKFTTANSKTYFERLKMFESGDRTMGKYYPIYRPHVGTYSILNDAYQSNRIQNTIYIAPDTKTMTEKKALLDQMLADAMNKVIMGAEISVWNQAVTEWYATGGQTMTDEVNKWYKEQKK